MAATMGAELAGQQLGIDERTIRRWSRKAGSKPADAIDAPSWERLGALALARAEKLVASGRANVTQLATIAGIAQRNQLLQERAATKKEEPESWVERFNEWCDETYPDRRLRAIAKLVPQHVIRVSLERHADLAPAEPEDLDPVEPDPEADLEWCKQLVGAAGDLVAFDAEYRRWEAERARWQDVISQRAERLRLRASMTYFEARKLAERISDDLRPTLPSWADDVAVDAAVGAPPEVMDDESLDLAVDVLDRTVTTLEREIA